LTASFRDRQLKVKRSDANRMASPPNSVEPVCGGGALFESLIFGIWMDIRYPFDESSMEGSAEPVGYPLLHVGDGLHQQVLEQTTDDMGIADREVEVPGRHIDAGPAAFRHAARRISSRCREKFSKRR
jgi:hypothetical protein